MKGVVERPWTVGTEGRGDAVQEPDLHAVDLGEGDRAGAWQGQQAMFGGVADESAACQDGHETGGDVRGPTEVPGEVVQAARCAGHIDQCPDPPLRLRLGNCGYVLRARSRACPPASTPSGRPTPPPRTGTQPPRPRHRPPRRPEHTTTSQRQASRVEDHRSRPRTPACRSKPEPCPEMTRRRRGRPSWSTGRATVAGCSVGICRPGRPTSTTRSMNLASTPVPTGAGTALTGTDHCPFRRATAVRRGAHAVLSTVAALAAAAFALVQCLTGARCSA